jgi:hypothetical protein
VTSAQERFLQGFSLAEIGLDGGERATAQQTGHSETFRTLHYRPSGKVAKIEAVTTVWRSNGHVAVITVSKDQVV